MQLQTQGKSVRALREQGFDGFGGTQRVEVDVRVIASSDRDLVQGMGQGRFRDDLYYRLNVVPIVVPPLRHRREDIPLLSKHFLKVSAEVAGLPAREIGEDALAALQSYEWPGNVRQLRNVMDWLLIMAPGDSREAIRSDMLPPDISAIAPTVLRMEKGEQMMTLPLRDAREVFESEYLLAKVNQIGRAHV